MSEHEPRHHEHEQHHKQPESRSPESEAQLKHLQEKAVEAAEKHSKVDVEHLRHEVKKHAEDGRDEAAKSTEREAPHHHQALTNELKQQALAKTLRRVQHHLKPTERNFSKFIHRPAVDKVSTIGAETVACPSGVLGGGLCALIGSGILLYLARTYGFEYNLFMFVVLFVGGFFLGVIIELLIRSLFKKHRSQE